MERNKRTALNEQIYQEAGEWFLEFRDGEPSVQTRSEFDLWVRRSPEHLAAYLEIAAIWNEAPMLESADKGTLIARASQDQENIVPLVERSKIPDTARKARMPRIRFSRYAVSVASILLACVIGAWLWWVNYAVYATGVGEQRIIALKDGSRIELNARSKLRVRYSASERGIELLAGQALFSVAKDARRPFVVDSGNTHVRAVGTQFDVYRKPTGTVVTVVEGQVAIQEDRAALSFSSLKTDKTPAPPVLISAGQQLVVTRYEIKKPVAANVANVTAWTQRQLAFDAATLSEVAEEFNRYNERQLIIRDGAAFEFKISGVFSSSDPAGLIRFLRDRPGIRVVESPSEIVIERVEGTANENSRI